MKKFMLGFVAISATALSSLTFAGASVDESALAICAKNIRAELGVSHYTTFEKEVGVVRQEDGSIHYFLNASYKTPEMDEAKQYRSICDGQGFQASVDLVDEGSWQFRSGRSLSQQVANIGF